MDKAIVVQNTELDFPTTSAMTIAGQVANAVASQHVFKDYLDRRAANTVNRQAHDLAVFSRYLVAAKIVDAPCGFCLQHKPKVWRDVTWGLVEGFIKWQLGQGYAVPSVNVRLSTVKTYAKLAIKAGALDRTEYAMIQTVSGYSHKEARNVDKLRTKTRISTVTVRQPDGTTKHVKRTKKKEPVIVTPERVAQLKNQPDTPQGRRDALIMSLLVELGLRVGELCGLTVDCFDLKAGTLTFYREKVGLTQTHNLNGAWEPARRYFEAGDAPEAGPVLRASRKSGELADSGMTRFGVAKRVRELGEAMGVKGLSPHDLRHHWATQAANKGTSLEALMQAGGWSSPAMPMRYIEAAKVANEGIK